MARRSSNNYIDNKKMLAAFIDHKNKIDEARKNGLPDPPLSNYIGECFNLLAEKIASRGNFAGYTYIDEMKDDGIESCVMGANNFDPTKTNNPFGYFSKAIWMAFLRRIEKEHKETYIKFKSKEIMILSTDEDLSINGSADNLEIMDGVIKNFEDKVAKKRSKAKNIELTKNGTRFIRKKKSADKDLSDDEIVVKQNTDLRLIAEFIAKGKKIQYIPTGVRSTDIPEDTISEESILPKEELDYQIDIVDVVDDYNEFE